MTKPIAKEVNDSLRANAVCRSGNDESARIEEDARAYLKRVAFANASVVEAVLRAALAVMNVEMN